MCKTTPEFNDICDLCAYILDEKKENEDIMTIYNEACRPKPNLEQIKKSYHACYKNRKIRPELKPISGYMRQLGLCIRKIQKKKTP